MLALSTASLSNAERIIGRSTSAVSRWDRMLKSSIRCYRKGLYPIVIDRDGEWTGGEIQAQQGHSRFIEALEMQFADGRQPIILFQVVGGSIAQDVAETDKVGGFDHMCLSFDPQRDASIGRSADRDVFGSKSSQVSVLRSGLANGTIAEGHATVNPIQDSVSGGDA